MLTQVTDQLHVANDTNFINNIHNLLDITKQNM